jgi:small-conductance mechanosensitive channel
LFERPFRLGDVVVIKGQRGVVETIGIRTTTLRADDNVVVLVPNSMVFAEVVANRTYATPAPESAPAPTIEGEAVEPPPSG